MSNTNTENNVRFKIAKVDVVTSEGNSIAIRQTIEALRDDDSVITTFTLDSNPEAAGNLGRIKEQSLKKLSEYQSAQKLIKIQAEFTKRALALEGKIIGEKAATPEERWIS